MAVLSQVVVRFAADIANFTTDMNRAGRLSQKNAKAMGRAFKAAGLVVGTALTASAREAIKFQSAMAEVSTLVGDTTNMDALADSVRDMSREFGIAPVEEAKALYQIISAGASDAASQMELLTAANKLSIGGITEVETAANALTSTLNAYSLDASEAGRISDIMFATMKGGKTTISEISATLGNVVTIAAQTGVSFAELGASVATVTKAGVNTSQAMDGLRGVLSAVLKQSPQAVQAAEKLGINFNKAAIESMGFANWLEDVRVKTLGNAEAQAKLFGRVEALTQVMSLGANGGKEFASQLESMKTSAGATDEAVAKMMETTEFQLNRLKVSVQLMAESLGSELLPVVSQSAAALTDTGDGANFAAKAGRFFANILRVLIAAGIILKNTFEAVSHVIVAFGVTVINTFKALVSPVNRFVQGIATAFHELSQGNFRNAADAMSTIAGRVKADFVRAGNEISSVIGDQMVEAFGDLTEGVDNANNAILGITPIVTDLAPELEKTALDAASLGATMDDTAESVGSVADALPLVAEEVAVTGNELAGMAAIIENTWKRLDDTFADFWSNLLRGGGDALESLKNLVLDTLAQIIHQLTTKKIVMSIGASFGAGNAMADGGSVLDQIGQTGGLESLFANADLGGAAFGAALGVGFSEAFFDGGSASKTLGAIGGAVAGAIGGPLAGAMGAAWWSFVGSFFDREARLSLSGGQTFGSNGGQSVQTAFGTLRGSNGAGGVGMFLDDNSVAGKIRQGIVEFDAALASFMNSDQIGKITETLAEWDITLKGSAVTMENILGSRFTAILSTFSANTQAYVRSFTGLEDQTAALGRYVSALNLVTAALAEFIASEPGRKIQEDLGSSTEQLHRQAIALSDAFANFDNTPEALNAISQMVAQRYASEIEFLNAIDSLVQGIAQSIEEQQNRLRSAAGLAGQATGTPLADAIKLFRQLGEAGSPEQIASMVAQIQGLVDTFFGGLSAEDQARQAQGLIDFLDKVQAGATEQLGVLADNAILEGQLLREQAAEFAEAQGIQLDAINASTENVTAAVDRQTDVIEDGNTGTHDRLGRVEGLLEEILATDRRRLDAELVRG